MKKKYLKILILLLFLSIFFVVSCSEKEANRKEIIEFSQSYFQLTNSKDVIEEELIRRLNQYTVKEDWQKCIEISSEIERLHKIYLNKLIEIPVPKEIEIFLSKKIEEIIYLQEINENRSVFFKSNLVYDEEEAAKIIEKVKKANELHMEAEKILKSIYTEYNIEYPSEKD